MYNELFEQINNSEDMEECVCHIYGLSDQELIKFYNKNNKDGWGNAINTAYGNDKAEVEAEIKKRGLFENKAPFDNTKLVEKLAALEHDQWAHWTKYMLANLTDENIARWKSQIDTPYSKLSEKEKDSDREWAHKVLKITEEQ